MTKRLTQEEFVKKAREVHGDKYCYDMVAYDNYLSKVRIVCTEHGIFEQRASGHLTGKGCALCAKECRPKSKKANASSAFLNKVATIKEHANKDYSYTKVIYKSARTKVTVTCEQHGDFEITPNNLLSGRGCPDCSENGYRRSKPGSIYVLSCGAITKVGITNTTAKERCAAISKSRRTQFSVIYEARLDDGEVPCRIETSILSELKRQYKQPDERFEGFTECFLDVDMALVLNRIEELIATQTKEQHSSQQA